MSPQSLSAQQLQDKAIEQVADRWGKAFGCLLEKQHPHWKRVQDALPCFKGLSLDHLPPKLERRIDQTFAAVNTVLARYTIETWDDYQKISADDLATLEALIDNMPPNG